LAHQHIKIPVDLVDPQELSSGKTDEKLMVLYLSLYYNAFKDKSAGESKESLMRRLAELEAKFRSLSAENEALKAAKSALDASSKDLTSKLSVVKEEKTKALTTQKEVSTSLGKLKENYESESQKLLKQISELTAQITSLKSSSDSTVTNLQNEKDKAAKERDAVREELKKTKEQFGKEKEELQAKQDELNNSIARNKKMREELESIRKQQQENQQKTIAALRKHLLQHVQDMHTWKPILESDREYKAGDLKIQTDAALEKLSFTKQVEELDKTIVVDNEKLAQLVHEREVESAEVVSVNMGKKKKRLKKGADGQVIDDDEDDKAKAKVAPKPAGAKK